MQTTLNGSNGNGQYATATEAQVAQLMAELTELKRDKGELETKRFIDSSIAKYSELMRWRVDHTLDKWADELLLALVPNLDGLQASLYFVKNEGEERLYWIGGFACPEEIAKEIDFGVGLTGQCAKSKQFMYYDDKDAFAVYSYSSLSRVDASVLVIAPLVFNEKVEGVLEISSLNPFTEAQLKLIRVLSEQVAANLNTIRSQVQIAALLKEAQEKSETLQAQEEEMRQNLEELEATQEEMRRGQQMIAQNEARMKAIIESTDDPIVVVNRNLQLQNYNSSWVKRLTREGYEPKAEDGIQQAVNDQLWYQQETFWQKALAGDTVTSEFHIELKKETEYYEVVYRPLVDRQGSVYAACMFARNITERKAAEKQIFTKNQELEAQSEELRQQMEMVDASNEALKLAQSEMQAQMSAIDGIAGIIEFNTEGIIQSANSSFLGVVGYSMQEIKGKHHRIFVRPELANSQEYRDFWKKLSEGGSEHGEFERVDKEGKSVWIRGAYSAVKDLNGKVLRVIKVCQDVTPLRAAAERQAQLLNEVSLAQMEIKAQLAAIDNICGIIEFTTDGTITNANTAFLNVVGYTLDEIKGKHHRIFMKPEAANTQGYIDFWNKLGVGGSENGEFERVNKEGSSVWIRGAYTAVKDQHGKVLRVMKVCQDITPLRQAAAKQAQLVEELRAADEELRQQMNQVESMNDVLKLTQAELSAQMESISGIAGIIEFNTDGTIIQANPNFLKVVGYTMDEIKGKHHSMFVKPEYGRSKEYVEHWQTLANGGSIHGEFERVAKDGSSVYIRGAYSAVKDNNGRVLKTIKVVVDVTPLRRAAEEQSEMITKMRAAEEELRQNMEEMEATQEEVRRMTTMLQAQMDATNNAAIVSEADIQGNIIFVNDAFTQISKYNREELMGNNHRVVKSGLMDDSIYEDLWRTIAGGKVWKGDILNKAKDGTLYWVNTTITPVLGPDRKPIKYIRVSFDITKQKMQEQKIKEQLEEIQSAEEELRQQMNMIEVSNTALRTAQDELAARMSSIDKLAGIIEFTTDGIILSANENFLNAVGYTMEEIKGRHHRIFVKPELATSVAYIDFWQRLAGGESVQGEFERINKLGNSVWIRGTYSSIKDSTGKVLRCIKVCQDITPLRDAAENQNRLIQQLSATEEELRQQMTQMDASQQELNRIKQVFEQFANNAPGVLVQFGTNLDLGNGRVAYASPKCIELLGYAPEEMTKMTTELFYDLIHADDVTRYRQKFEQAMKTLDKFCWEGKLRHRNGSYVTVKADGQATRTKEGTLLCNGYITPVCV